MPMYILVMAAAEIMEAIYRKETYKRRLEELSWLRPEDFEGQHPGRYRNMAEHTAP